MVLSTIFVGSNELCARFKSVSLYIVVDEITRLRKCKLFFGEMVLDQKAKWRNWPVLFEKTSLCLEFMYFSFGYRLQTLLARMWKITSKWYKRRISLKFFWALLDSLTLFLIPTNGKTHRTSETLPCKGGGSSNKKRGIEKNRNPGTKNIFHHQNFRRVFRVRQDRAGNFCCRISCRQDGIKASHR